MVDDLDSRMTRIEQLAQERLGGSSANTVNPTASASEITEEERLQVESLDQGELEQDLEWLGRQR